MSRRNSAERKAARRRKALAQVRAALASAEARGEAEARPARHRQFVLAVERTEQRLASVPDAR